MNIIDIMTTEIIHVGETTPVSVAINLMQEYNVRHLVVISGDCSLVGIVSDRDLRLAAQSPFTGLDPVEADDFAEKILIKQVMTRSPYCVSPMESIAEAAHLLLEHHINAAPVMQDGSVIGIVTSTDLLKVLVAQPI